MNYSDMGSDLEWEGNAIVTTPAKRRKVSGRSRFSEVWLDTFKPWLIRCPDNPQRPYCKACNCSIESNVAHVTRHSKTIKHSRNVERYLSVGESFLPPDIHIRKGPVKYYKPLQAAESYAPEEATSDNEADDYRQYIYEDELYEDSADQVAEDFETMPEEVVDENISEGAGDTIVSDDVEALTKAQSRLEEEEVEDDVEEEEEDDDDDEQLAEDAAANTAQTAERDNKKLTVQPTDVDLFFESIKSTVNQLPAKLRAEAKMKIQSLVCELEFRALEDFKS